MNVSLVGRTLGKYEIVGFLGHGGMATVYKGYHREIDRHLAIKVLPPHPGRDPQFVERFRLEALTVARLQHPHILSLYDYGVEEDVFFLAMAYISGGSLEDLLDAGQLQLTQIEKILREIGEALDYAHSQGVIHRDIKPANILLDGNGRALLADFGIAKLTARDATPESKLTGTDIIMGTPSYMAPEQGMSLNVDWRADIYALGVLAYEMLTGKRPYLNPNPFLLLLQHANDPIPNILHERKDLPLAVQIVMQRVMAKMPEERYQTALEFGEAFSLAIHSNAGHSHSLAKTPLPGSPTNSQKPEKTKQLTSPYSTVIFADDSSIANISQRIYTFLFTDIEGSTRLWENRAQEMSEALAYHDEVMAETVRRHHGIIFKTSGDSICAVFDSGTYALQAALQIQRLLYEVSIRPDAPLLQLPVRMALYSGPAETRANDFFGPTLNRVARLMSAASGGQILVSSTTKEQLSPELELRDLGEHRLRDLNEALHIFQATSPHFPLNANPIRSLVPHPSNLPAQLSSFVGREQNVEELCHLLRQPSVRLLTLLGPGGIGKTRLSIQVATTLLDEYEDGVFFIPLAPLNQTEAIIKELAQSLNIQEDPATPLLESIKNYLQARQMLLVFDNFEHLLETAPLLNELLTASARLKILVSSRESLFIYGERTYTVPPLDLPEPNDGIALILKSSAVRLFIERVQALQPEFRFADNDASNVVKICRQLEGLPLALELAAARVRDMTLQDIAAQLSQRLDLLSKGQRDLSSRQRTMRGTIEWSYRLLSAAEQAVFARLAVFEGHFFEQAAQAVSNFTDLSAFKNKSLLQQSENQSYSMLAVLREYAMERLIESGELKSTQEKHAKYYAEWLELSREHLNGRHQLEWFSRLKVEEYNLQATLEWSLQQDIERAARMAGSLWRYWSTQSLLSEGQRQLDLILAHAEKLSPLAHAEVTQGAGRLAVLQNDFLKASALQQKSLAVYKQLNHLPGQAAVLLSLGETEYVQGNYLNAEVFMEECLSIFRMLEDQAGIGRCLNLMGKIASQNRNFIKAEPLLRESLDLAREHGSAEGIALAYYSLGGVLRIQGKYQEAENAYRQSLAIYQELDFAIGIATMLYNIGFAFQGLGKYSDAMKEFVNALKLLQNLEEPIALAECLIGIAGSFLHLNKHLLCIQTLSAANALLVSVNADGQLEYVDQLQYEHIYEATKSEPDDSQWQAAWKAGQSVLIEQFIQKIFTEA
jgi:predicted ATPase/serine/threonine protein kinase